MADRVFVSKLDALVDGQGLRVEAFGDRVCVVRTGGELFAVYDVCPHRGGSLSQGTFEDGNVTCPLHAWKFELSTGNLCTNPTVRIPTYAVSVEGDDVYLSRS